MQFVITRGTDCDSRGDEFIDSREAGDAAEQARDNRRPERRHALLAARPQSRQARSPASGPAGPRRRCSRAAAPRRICRDRSRSKIDQVVRCCRARHPKAFRSCTIARRTFGAFDGPRPRDSRIALLLGTAASFAQDPAAPIPLFPGRRPARSSPAPVARTRNARFAAIARGAGDCTGARRLADPAPRAGSDRARLLPAAGHGPARRSRFGAGTLSRISRHLERRRLDAAALRRAGVENVAPDGTATILYAFGPIGSNARGPGGVLNGTGIVQDGELRFQNSDGSQFAFRPLYADLEGRLTTPQGQSYHAIFKKTP